MFYTDLSGLVRLEVQRILDGLWGPLALELLLILLLQQVQEAQVVPLVQGYLEH